MNVDRPSYFKTVRIEHDFVSLWLWILLKHCQGHKFDVSTVRYSRILANKNRFLVKYKTAHIGNPHGNQSQKLAVCEPLHLIIKCQTHINHKLKHLALISAVNILSILALLKISSPLEKTKYPRKNHKNQL